MSYLHISHSFSSQSECLFSYPWSYEHNAVDKIIVHDMLPLDSTDFTMNKYKIIKSHQIDFCLNSPNCQSWDFFSLNSHHRTHFSLSRALCCCCRTSFKIRLLTNRAQYTLMLHALPPTRCNSHYSTKTEINLQIALLFQICIFFLKKLVFLFTRPTYLSLSVTHFKWGW